MAQSIANGQGSRVTNNFARSAEAATVLCALGAATVSLPQLLEQSTGTLLHEMSHWRAYGAVAGFDPSPYLSDYCGPRQIVFPTKNGPPTCSIITRFMLYAEEHGAGWAIWQSMTLSDLSDTPLIREQFPDSSFEGKALLNAAGNRTIPASALGMRLGELESVAYFTLGGVLSDVALYTSMAFVLGYASGVAWRSAHCETVSQRVYGHASLVAFAASLRLGILAMMSMERNSTGNTDDIGWPAYALAEERGVDADDLRTTFITLLMLPPLIAPVLGLAAAQINKSIALSDACITKLLILAANDATHPFHERARDLFRHISHARSGDLDFTTAMAKKHLEENPQLVCALVETLQGSLDVEVRQTWAQTTLSMASPIAMMLPLWRFLENSYAISHGAGQAVHGLALTVGVAKSIDVVARNRRRVCAPQVEVPMAVRVLRGLEDACTLTAGISFVAAAARELQDPPDHQSVESAFGLNPDYLVAMSATAAGWILGAARRLMEQRFVRQHVKDLALPLQEMHATAV